MIESERLVFRDYQATDSEFLYSMISDSETMKFIGNGQVRDRDGAKRFMEQIFGSYETRRDLGLKLLIDKNRRRPVGHAGLVPQTIEGVPEIEVGYWIHRDFWGHGYASEAALALRNHGLEQLHYTRLVSLIQPGNTASRRVAEKIGMKLERNFVRKGQDVCLYSLSVV